MRKLMWFTVGFGAACAVCAGVWQIPGLPWVAAGLAALSVGLLVGFRRIRWVAAASVVLLGAAGGFGWFSAYSALYLNQAVAMDGEIAPITAICADYSYDTDYGTAVDASVTLEGKTYRTKLYLNIKRELEPGDGIEGTFRFRVTTPGGEKDATHHQGKGIFLLGYQKEDVRFFESEEISWKRYPAVLRRQLTELIDSCFPEDTAGFARALLIGDRTCIDYATNTAFKMSGIMHVIAVSGLHVSILFGLIHAIGLRRRIPTALLGIPALLLFAAVAGFTPSVNRACIMQILMILAMLFDREYDSPTELAFSVLVMLIANPLVITSVSFQLSVGCLVGIFLFYGRLYEWMCGKLKCGKHDRFRKQKRWFAGSVAVSLSAMVPVTPLCAYYFGTVSLVGILTNLLTLWAVNLAFYGIMLTCAVGAAVPAVGGILAWFVSWPIRYVLVTAKLLAKFPWAVVYTKSIYTVIWLVFVYVLLAVFLFSRKRCGATFVCCAAVGLSLALMCSWVEPMLDRCRMTVLDVGQGQSIILRSEGRTYLVDCGGSYDADAADLAAETLMSQGVFRLDGVILTHFDRDHSGGLPYLLTRVKTDALFIPEAEDTTGIGEALFVPAGGNVIRIREDTEISYCNTTLTLFAPGMTNSDNESSLAILFQAENCDILITGDRGQSGEKLLLRRSSLPQLDVLVAGHHGSKNATGTDLLDATRPEIAVISVGDNSYGHPAEEVLTRLQEYGCAVHRTDLDGTFIFRR